MSKKKIAFVLDADLVDTLRALVKRDSLNQSMFIQNALTRAIRNHRSAMEFIAEGRSKKERGAAPGALDLGQNRPDGVPKGGEDRPTPENWRIMWNLSKRATVERDINQMRNETGQQPITEAEWQAVVKYMGSEPGVNKSKGEQWGEELDD